MNKILYSQCWEDPLILSDAFNINKKDTVLSISSAGDNSLFLLSKNPKMVVSLDINSAQNFLLELKAAAIKSLDYEQCLKFLGFLECEDREGIYKIILHGLSEECKRYWDLNIKFIHEGVIHMGKLERYLSIFRNAILPISHSKKDIEELLSLDSIEDQEIFFKKRWDSFLWRSTFRVFFSKFVLKLLGRDKSFFKYNNKESVANHYLEKTRFNLTRIPVKSNYFLYYILKGKFSMKNLPEYMKHDNFYKIKKNIGSLKIITSDLESYLRSCKKNTFSKFNLSDVFEVYSQEKYDFLMSEIVRVSKRNAIVCYWNNLIERSKHKEKKLIVLNRESDSLFKKDRVLFYSKFIVEKSV